MMPKIHEKIMQINFAKRLKKIIISMVCVALLGGGLSTALLAPQIREAVSSARAWEQNRVQQIAGSDGESSQREDSDDESRRREDKERGDGESVQREDKERGDNEASQREHKERGDDESGWRKDEEEHDREEYDYFDHMTITMPSPAALIAVGITGLLVWVLMILYWLCVAAWLYQAAVLSGMNGLVWLMAGLIGNIFAAALFLLVRNFVRVKCPSCGSFSHIKTQCCTACGTAFHENCENCGADCAAGDKFCRACGKKLHEENA